MREALSPALRFPHQIADTFLGVGKFVRGNLGAVVKVFDCRVAVQIRVFERERGGGSIKLHIGDFKAANQQVSGDIEAGRSDLGDLWWGLQMFSCLSFLSSDRVQSGGLKAEVRHRPMDSPVSAPCYFGGFLAKRQIKQGHCAGSSAILTNATIAWSVPMQAET